MKGQVDEAARVAIVDYGLGNLFSVLNACRAVGLKGEISSNGITIANADSIILPGVGAFGDAMTTLRRMGLVDVIRGAVAAGKPVVGLCLGIQLLMEESEEFGRHKGLGLIPGRVVRLAQPQERGRIWKVPQVGWNRIVPSGSQQDSAWNGTLLDGLRSGEFMYFVHSFVAVPEDEMVTLSTTRYGEGEFCSSLQRGSIFACQFHPERSGQRGLRVYENLRRALDERPRR